MLPHTTHMVLFQDLTDPAVLLSLGDEIATHAENTRHAGPWKSGVFHLFARTGILAAFIPIDCGGTGASERVLIELFLAIARRCLTSALALSQWAAAVRIIDTSHDPSRTTLLADLASGRIRATVGISQISTSRRHLSAPALLATQHETQWSLTGLCPWVTGGDSSDLLITAAVTNSGETKFFCVPLQARGLCIEPPMKLLALSGSRTSAVHFDRVDPGEPIDQKSSSTVRTGGLATSALALGAACGSVDLIEKEAAARPSLRFVVDEFQSECRSVRDELFDSITRDIEPMQRNRLRLRANNLVVRVGQAFLTATKGTGFIEGHPAADRVCESLFFLVWSCPPSVSAAAMCELAGLDPDSEFSSDVL